jgi:hypothetical protein
VNRLDAALSWYEANISSLEAIQKWLRAGKPSGDVTLLALVGDYQHLSRQQALTRLKQQREDTQRMALVRLFSGFEADFRDAFAHRLKASCDALDPESSHARLHPEIAVALPESIDVQLRLHRALEPRFSGSDKGWLDGLRGWRNSLLHHGFEEPVRHDPSDVHQKLASILGTVIRRASYAHRPAS